MPNNFGLDTDVLDYLMQKRRPQVSNPDNAMSSAMMQAAAAAGTLGGKTADTSGVQNLAKNLDQRNMQMGQAQDDRQMKIAQYMQNRQNRGELLGDRAKKRTYDENQLTKNREYKEGMLTKQTALADSKRKTLRDEAIEDYGKKQHISQGYKKEALALKNAPKSYLDNMKTLSGEQMKRFDSAAMGLAATVDMQKFLRSGNNTFSAVGDNQFTEARRIYIEALGRMQSGGAIQKDELKSFADMAPTMQDSTAIQKQKMLRLITEMTTRVGNLGFDPQEVLSRRNEIAERVKTQYNWDEPTEPGTAVAAPTKIKKVYKDGQIKTDKDGNNYRFSEFSQQFELIEE